MKDDTVRRLQALEEEYPFPADTASEGHAESVDEFAAALAMLETLRGDAA
jgi:hypothetical protein